MFDGWLVIVMCPPKVCEVNLREVNSSAKKRNVLKNNVQKAGKTIKLTTACCLGHVMVQELLVPLNLLIVLVWRAATVCETAT